MSAFITLQGEGKSELEITKSIFIGHAAPVNGSEEATQFVDRIRSQYPDAKHNCYAWIVNGSVTMQKYSDDGEPQGTAGLPILSCLTKPGISNAAVVVTRYFGGVLLGKGGLVRAYSEAASEALKNAGIIEEKSLVTYAFNCDYSLSERISYELKAHGYRIDKVSYGADVAFEVTCLDDDKAEFIGFITELGLGKIVPLKVNEFVGIF